MKKRKQTNQIKQIALVVSGLVVLFAIAFVISSAAPLSTVGKATSGCHHAKPGSGWYCSARCPCEAGEGDCDSDAQCVSGTTCKQNVGAKYGWPSFVDVCESESGCADSDGGKNYYVKGSATGATFTGGSHTVNDGCIRGEPHDGWLREAICDGNVATWVDHQCSFGCQDGACIRKPQGQEEPSYQGVLNMLSQCEVLVPKGKFLSIFQKSKTCNGVCRLAMGGTCLLGYDKVGGETVVRDSNLIACSDEFTVGPWGEASYRSISCLCCQPLE